MSEQQTFGYVNVWARNTLEALMNEYEFDKKSTLVSGSVSITEEQAKELISYLQSADFGDYGAKLDIAIFYNPERKVVLSGAIKTPYTKGEGTSKASRAKRKMV